MRKKKKKSRPVAKWRTGTMSVKEYADMTRNPYTEEPYTRFGVIWQINNNSLPDGVKAEKVGRSYVITVTK